MTAIRSNFEQKLGWVALTLLLAGCFWVISPFVSALLWSAVLSYSIWPLFERLLRAMGGRRTLAALLMGLGMVCIILIPFVIVGVTMGDNVKELASATRRWLDQGPPAPPAWLAKLPVVGPTATERWKTLASDSTQLLQAAKRLIEPASAVALKAGIVLGRGLFELALSIFITFFLLRDGLSVAAWLKAGVGRIAGDRGRHLLEVAGLTVRGVVYGILGTALVQAVMAGFGFVIAGVPGAALLALLTFCLSPIPFGPPLILLPVAFWLFHQGATGWGIFMIIWGVGVSTIDNLVKPWLISQGSDMPFILILFGVLGGALAFGFIGVFIGPTLLAVGYRIIREWIATSRATAARGDMSDNVRANNPSGLTPV